MRSHQEIGSGGASLTGSDDATPAFALRVIVDLAAFGCELAMLVLLAIAGWDYGNGGLLGIALAVFYPALVILVWAVWVAPNSRRRLPDPARLVLQFVLFIATGAAIGFAGHVVTGIVFPILAAAVFFATRSLGTEQAALAANGDEIALDDDSVLFDDYDDLDY